MNLINQYYTGNNAENYESIRNFRPKWRFEEETFVNILDELHDEIKSIIDAPVGTGRFLEHYKKYKDGIYLYAIDYSSDMLKIVQEKCDAEQTEVIKHDIINKKLDVLSDLTVCYRFLNLFSWNESSKALENLFSASKKYILFTIRLVENDYQEEMFIENKIYLHRNEDIHSLIVKSDFKIVKKFTFKDHRTGTYTIFLCKRHDNVISSRVNKNNRAIFQTGLNSGTMKVKIYQAHNDNHARFIEKISSLFSDIFPHTKAKTREFVEADWVDGSVLGLNDWTVSLELLNKIYSLKCADESSFDYVEDLIIPRFYLAHPLVGIDICDKIVSKLKTEALRYEQKISHPDLQPSNIIKTKTGFKIIDNELLCKTRYHRIDILNLVYNYNEADRKNIFQAYFKITNLKSDIFNEESDFLNTLWLARQVGSFLIKNKPMMILATMKKYFNNENILPFTLE